MKRSRYLGVLTIVGIVFGMVVAGCGSNDDLVQIPPDPKLIEQPATTAGIGADLSSMKKGGG